MDDPKMRVKSEPAEAPPQFITLTPEQFAALAGGRADSDDVLRKQAQFQAEATKKALRPENEQHPGISVFRPNGRDDTLQLKCKMTWVGYPLDADGVTPEEIAALNEIDQIGEFPYHKTDGSLEKFTIRGEKDAHGRWSALHFSFPCRGINKHNQPSKVNQLREVRAAMLTGVSG